ncbi:Uncharacterised protein [Actinobaculum suis]|uniref:Phage tail protein n=1 Tax=Actinobaculum suis TaxID=1657 RepID=A0A7Z8YA88_9ACTO|nr:hypothetical protein [Actinobaculum suis]VDG76912.1 Uncharacterised protein [Actinobaculum suis]
MAARNRLTGSTLSLIIDGNEYKQDVSEYEYSEDEKDSGTLTFADAAAGAIASGKLKVTMIQSLDTDSLHQVMMEHPGKRAVPFTLAPLGNSSPSPTQPHFTGTVDFPRTRPSLGLAAGDDDATTEVELKVTGWKKITSPGSRSL